MYKPFLHIKVLTNYAAQMPILTRCTRTQNPNKVVFSYIHSIKKRISKGPHKCKNICINTHTCWIISV